MAIKVITPKGTARYPHLTKPDTRFAKGPDGGKFKVDLVLSKEDGEGLVETIKELALEDFGVKKAKTSQLPYDVDTETGNFIFKFKSGFRPAISDARGQLIGNPEDLRIGGGSIIKVDTKVDTWDNEGKHGVLLRLNGVQLLKYVEYGAGGSFGDASDEVDDGYVADNGKQAAGNKEDDSDNENTGADASTKGSTSGDATSF